MPHFTFPVPRQWSKHIKSAFIHTISLASTAFTSTCALASKRRATVTRLKAELAQAYQKIALLREEMQIKDDRFHRISAHRRPYYTPIQRMQILKLRAARGWNIAQTAKAFLLSELTIISWMQRLDEEGLNALIQLSEPVNKFPAFVRSCDEKREAFIPVPGVLPK